MKTKVLLTFCLLLCWGMIAESFGQSTIIAWKTENEITGSQNSTTTHALLETGVLSRGSGMIYSASSTYTYTGVFPMSSSSRAVAITSNAYYQIAFKTKEGAVFSLSGLTVRLRKANASTANKYCWRYSVNGGTTFKDLGPEEIDSPIIPEGTNNGIVQDPIDLSGVSDLQNVSSGTQIIFRLYAWGGTSETVSANLGFGKSYFSSTANNPIEFRGVVTMPIAETPILTWRPSSGIDDPLVATEADENIAEAALNRGTGLTYIDNSTYTYTSIFPNGITSKVDAATANTYYEVTMKAKPGYYLNLSGLTSRLRRSSAGAVNSYRWAYSLNGEDFNDVGPDNVTMTIFGGDGEDQYLIDLSSISELKNVPSTVQVTFRLYIWGATANNTNTGLGKSYANSTNYNSLSFYGSVSNTLPVKLKSFNGKLEGDAVKLNWATVSEKNNSRFEVLRSSAVGQSAVIGTVAGNGTSNEVHHYNFIDYSPLQGTNYYQLRQIDHDGKSELSKIIAVSAGVVLSEMKVITSETDITAYIQGTAAGKARLYVSDITGKVLLDKAVVLSSDSNVLDIPIATHVKGIYIASLVTADGKRLNTRFYK